MPDQPDVPMRKKVVRPERRQLERRPSRLSALGEAVSASPWAERRVQCWHLDPDCTEESRRRCPAYFVRRNCWDLWAAEFFPPGRRPCCRPHEEECSDCRVATAKFSGDIAIYVDTPTKSNSSSGRATTATAYCQYLYNPRETPTIARGESDARGEFKCRRRPGILLHETYVSEVCSCLEHHDCVFYETE